MYVFNMIRKTAYILLATLLASCSIPPNEKQKALRLITDAAGREVMIPDSIESIIALRSGALRLLVYMESTDRVIAVEGNEKKRSVPYLFAHPELRELPVVGAGNLAEPELLASYNPDVIICTYLSSGEADELQQKTGVPVIVINYADFNENRQNFYKTLEFLGKILGNESRADNLITYIEISIADLKKRSRAAEPKHKDVYVGGIAYRGAHGIASTEPQYAPFAMLGAKNTAGKLGEVTSSPKAWLENAFIDIEQLIKWDPDIIFLDAAGRSVWEEDLQRNALQSSLTALKNQQVYSVLPHNWYTINYENILCNAFFIGKVLYPEEFEDIEIREKCNEIYGMFLGTSVYDNMMEKFEAYRRVEDGY